MSVCRVCSKSVNRTGQDKIMCVTCNNYFHCACVKLNRIDLDYYEQNSIDWNCDTCSSIRRSSRGLSDDIPVKSVVGDDVHTPLTFEAIKTLMTEMRNDILSGQKALEGELGKSIEACHDLISDLSRRLDDNSETIKRQQGEIDNLTLENISLKKDVNFLSTRLDDLDQYGRRGTMEVYGIPESDREDLVETVIGIGKAVDLNISKSSIDTCHRLKKLPGKTSSGIIIKFVRRSDAVSFQRGVRRKKLTTTDIGLSGGHPIFVNLSLTRSRRILLGNARKEVKNKHLSAAWVDWTGRVLVKKSEKDRPQPVNSILDLPVISQ